ncbi:hypothetical protein BS78_02G040900 [Paspalum vaginatum]|nr:hypothetical protein BS78_02G040900 [Paspalum vaginatum]
MELVLLLSSVAVPVVVWFVVLRRGGVRNAKRRRLPPGPRGAGRCWVTCRSWAPSRTTAPDDARAGETVRPVVPAPAGQRGGGGGGVGGGGRPVPARPRHQLRQPPAQLRRRAPGVQLPGPRVRALRLPRCARSTSSPPRLCTTCVAWGQGGGGRAYGEEARAGRRSGGAGPGCQRLLDERAGAGDGRPPAVRCRGRRRRRGRRQQGVQGDGGEGDAARRRVQRRRLRAGSRVARPAGRGAQDEAAAPPVRRPDGRDHQGEGEGRRRGLQGPDRRHAGQDAAAAAARGRRGRLHQRN